MWFFVVCTLIKNEYASLLFSPSIFSNCFCILSEFAKVLKEKTDAYKAAHLHNAARALSNPSGFFNCQGKDFVSLILW